MASVIVNINRRPVTVKVDKLMGGPDGSVTTIYPQFTDQIPYAINEQVSYLGDSYTFIAEHPAGAWDTAHVKLSNQVPSLWTRNATDESLSPATITDVVAIGGAAEPNTTHTVRGTNDAATDYAQQMFNGAASNRRILAIRNDGAFVSGVDAGLNDTGLFFGSIQGFSAGYANAGSNFGSIQGYEAGQFKLIDISFSGMAFQAKSELLKIDETLEVSLSLPLGNTGVLSEKKIPITCSIKIIHTLNTIYHCRFIKLTHQNKLLLDRFILNEQKHQIHSQSKQS